MQIPDWGNYGKEPDPWESLKSGDLDAALKGFSTNYFLELRRNMISDGPAIGVGVTLWLMGDTSGSAMVWLKVCEEAIKGHYAYSSKGTFQGGLLLWFASVWLNNDMLHDKAYRLLDKLIRKKRPIMGASFPSELAKLLRQEIDLSDIVKSLGDEPLYRERQFTLAMFYAGVKAYESGEFEEALKLWKQIKEPKNTLVELEYYLLIYERQRLISK